MIIFHANVMRQDIVLEICCQTLGLSVNGYANKTRPIGLRLSESVAVAEPEFRSFRGVTVTFVLFFDA